MPRDLIRIYGYHECPSHSLNTAMRVASGSVRSSHEKEPGDGRRACAEPPAVAGGAVGVGVAVGVAVGVVHYSLLTISRPKTKMQQPKATAKTAKAPPATPPQQRKGSVAGDPGPQVVNSQKGTTRYRRWFCILARMRGDIPLAYLFTFRSYGTWLHGDERGSVDRFHNQYGAPYFPPNEARQHQTERRLKYPPVILDSEQRESVSRAIRETCEVREWFLRALNVRTNHVHAVLSTEVRPELALNALKANATRQLRHDGRWQPSRSPWSDGGSRRYVWTEVGLERAIDYVVNGQDGPIPELDPGNRLR